MRGSLADIYYDNLSVNAMKASVDIDDLRSHQRVKR